MRYVFRKRSYMLLAYLADAAGRILTLGRRTLPAKFSPKKILIVRLDHLGDILPATAIPQMMKEHFEGAQVHFLTSAAGEALLTGNPFVDRVWVFSTNWYSRGQRASGGMRRRELVRALKREKFDLSFSLRGDARENWLLRQVGARPAIGYGITGGGFLLDIEASYPWGAHESEKTRLLLRRAGLHAEKLVPKIYFSQEEIERHKEDLKRLGFEGTGWIGFQADAGTPAKRWPLENLDRFLTWQETERPDLKIVFLGSDAKIGEWLRDRLAKRPDKNRVSLVGKTGLRQLFYVLKNIRCFIGPDSGPGHISAAVFDHPTLFLYSGTNKFEEWKSLSENAYFIRQPVPCAPCGLTRCDVERHPCMSGITAESVSNWLKEHAHV